MNSQLHKALLLLLLITGISCKDLKKDEIAKVKFELYGDFGSEQSQLTIFKANGLSKAKLETKGVGSYEAPIDEAGLKAFNTFLTELKSAGSKGYCTTVQACTVYTRNETVVKKNIDCSWDGFSELKESLFSIE